MATIRQFRIFLAVAEYKKMSLAARNLYISQPTVSQTISELEKEYNVKLFERYPKELQITPAGKLLLINAQKIVNLEDNLILSMKNIKDVRPLRVGATLSIGNIMMARMIEVLKEEHPDIDATVCIDNTANIEHRLLHNEIDIALVEGIIKKEEIATEAFFEDTLVLICGKSHPFAAKECITIDMLSNQDFILRENGSGTRAIFEDIMKKYHIPYQVKWQSNSTVAIMDAVERNLGLGVVSLPCAHKKIRNGELCICPVDGVSMKRFFFLCYNSKKEFNSQQIDFIQLLKRVDPYSV